MKEERKKTTNQRAMEAEDNHISKKDRNIILRSTMEKNTIKIMITIMKKVTKKGAKRSKMPNML